MLVGPAAADHGDLVPTRFHELALVVTGRYGVRRFVAEHASLMLPLVVAGYTQRISATEVAVVFRTLFSVALDQLQATVLGHYPTAVSRATRTTRLVASASTPELTKFLVVKTHPSVRATGPQGPAGPLLSGEDTESVGDGHVETHSVASAALKGIVFPSL